MKRGKVQDIASLETARARRGLLRILVPNRSLLGGIALFAASVNLPIRQPLAGERFPRTALRPLGQGPGRQGPERALGVRRQPPTCQV